MDKRTEEAIRLDGPLFSRCSVGNGNWFWVAYGPLSEVWERTIHSSGMAASSDEAEKDARASLARDFDMPARKVQSSYAAGVHRKMAIKKRATKMSNGKDAAQPEFLYTDCCSHYDGSWRNNRHRVVKKTAKRVFVERDSWSWEEDGQTYHDVRTNVLDREELEREGSAYCRRDRYTPRC